MWMEEKLWLWYEIKDELKISQGMEVKVEKEWEEEREGRGLMSLFFC